MKHPKTWEQINSLISQRRELVLHIAENLHDVSKGDYPYLIGIAKELDAVMCMIQDDRSIEIILKTNYLREL